LPTAIFSRKLTDVALGKEAVAIYDSSENTAPYLYYYYNDLSYNSGDAVNIVSADYSSNTFLTLRNRGGAGMAVGGGYLPGNMIMGSLALTDASNVKHSAMNIISGNLNKQIRTAIGVNKHSVVKEAEGINKYAMEVNGPVKIGHQEINVAAETTFEIFGQCFYDNSGFAFGTPTKEGSLLNQYILTTSDGGFTWKRTKLIKPVDNLETSDIIFNAGYSSKTEPLYLVGGEQNFLYYSTNYGSSWTNIIVVNTYTVNLLSVYLSPNKSRLIIGCYVSANSNYRILNSSGLGNVSTVLSSQIDVGLDSISAIDGFDNTFAYIIGRGGIRKFNITNNTYTIVVNSGEFYYGIKFYYDGSKYHSIVVGTYSIYYSHDVVAGSWTQVIVSGIIRSVYIVDAMRAYAVGDNGTILFSVDGYATWRKFTYDELNFMGNASRLWNTDLKNVWSRGANDLIITGTIANYVSNSVVGKSYIFDLFSPYFFNHDAYNVLELSGNMVMSGDLRINDEGRLMTNNSSFYVLPENASQIYIGNTAVGGKTNVLNNLDVCGNEIVYGNLLVVRDVSINQNLFVMGRSGFNGDVSMNGNLMVNRDASFNGNLAILYDVSINRSLFVTGVSKFISDVSMNGNLEVNQNTTSLKMGLGKKTITAGYTLDISGNVYIPNGFIQQW
jgi:hypothetical protein